MKPKFAVETIWRGKPFRSYWPSREEAEAWIAFATAPARPEGFRTLERRVVDLNDDGPSAS